MLFLAVYTKLKVLQSTIRLHAVIVSKQYKLAILGVICFVILVVVKSGDMQTWFQASFSQTGNGSGGEPVSYILFGIFYSTLISIGVY